jgi:hypothetical protein
MAANATLERLDSPANNSAGMPRPAERNKMRQH